MEQIGKNKLQVNNEDKNQKNLNEKNISIINLIKNPFIKKKIDSPRSLKSMKNLGYQMDEIYHISFPQFLDKNKEIKKLPEELQKNKYEFYEEYRKIKIGNIKIERDRLIQELGEEEQNINKSNNKKENIERKNIIKELKSAEAELENKILMKKNINYDQKEKMMERKKRREGKEIERKKK